MSNLDDKLKLVESGSTSFQTVLNKTASSLTGTELFFTKASRTDLTVRPYGNLFSSFNLPITTDQKNLFASGGTFYDTAITNINQDNVIVIEIPKNEYGEVIDGKTIKLTIPQMTGATQYEVICYGTYFNDSTLNITNGNTNSNYSDSSPQAEYFGVPATSDNNYNTNIAFLFSNSIKTPQVNSGSTTWAEWSSLNKFDVNNPISSTTAKQFAQYNGVSKDEVVGIAYLDKGFFVITNQTLVNNFYYSGATSSGYDSITSGSTYSGGTSFTQIYFTGSTLANATFSSYKTEFVQNITCFAMPDEFYESENPTYIETYPNGNPDNNPLYITEIGLYNENKELIAIAKTSEPILKDKFNTLSFNIQLKI
jgi:hypothetical protein